MLAGSWFSVMYHHHVLPRYVYDTYVTAGECTAHSNNSQGFVSSCVCQSGVSIVQCKHQAFLGLRGIRHFEVHRFLRVRAYFKVYNSFYAAGIL